MKRLTAIVVSHIEAAIESLEIPESVKEQIEYDVISFLTPVRSALVTGGPPELTVGWMVGLGLPTRAGDYLMPFFPLNDPHDQHEIGRLVATLLGQVQQEVTLADTKAVAPLNGHRGLVLPK